MTTTAPAPTDAPSVDTADLEAFTGRFVTDLAAVAHAATVVIGDRLGLYAALADRGPSTPDELAAATGTHPRYVREWLCAQAASEYAHYDPASGRFHLDVAQAQCLADEQNPAFLAGGMFVASSLHRDQDTIEDAFRSGEGVGWHEHHDDLFSGTERFFRPGYAANLTSSWIPALDDVEPKLVGGARVADLGCGFGASTILLAEAYPASTFVGFDYHEASIDAARRRAIEAGVADRVSFEVASAHDYPGGDYDLVCTFDALHDMGDPTGASAHVLSTLAPDGTWLVVEPNAADRVEDNLHLVGRIFYSASTFICTPGSKAQPGAACLGAQAGEAKLREVVTAGGFTRFRRATETPFNIVLEARP